MKLHELPSPNGTIIIEGNGTGINGITVELNGKYVNIIDLLNDSLEYAYCVSYDDVVEEYETKLQTDDLYDYAFPDEMPIPNYLNKLIYEYATYPDDDELYKAVVTEYNAALLDIENNKHKWEAVMEQWYKTIAADPERAKLQF
jgi:hypothetical protein